MPDADDRKKVKWFFEFRLDVAQIKRGHHRYPVPLVLAVAGSIFGALIANGSVDVAIIVGLLTFFVALLLDHLFLEAERKRRQQQQNENHRRFMRLAAVTRRVMSHDMIKALERLFDRTLLTRDELQPLNEQYILPVERVLFHEDSLETKLGDLHNKSIQTIVPAEPAPGQEQQIRRFSGDGGVEWLSDRIRVTVVLLPRKTQLVICEAIIDLVTGSLKEEIQRIPYDRIVTIRMSATCDATLLSKQEARREAEWLPDATSDLQNSRNTPNDGDASPCLREIVRSRMIITLTDGREVTIPVSYTKRFSNDVSPLDRSDTLTSDERWLDRVVNELNRMVESAA